MGFLKPSEQTNWKYIGIIGFVAAAFVGFLLLQQPQIQQSSAIVGSDPTRLPTVTPIDTNNWQTYHNDFGFEVKYPGDWTLNDGNGISMGKNSYDVGILISNNGSEKYVEDIWQSVECAPSAGYGEGCSPLENIETKKLELNGNLVYWKINGNNQIHAFIPNEQTNKTVEIYTVNLRDKNLFHQILSTFRFVESTKLDAILYNNREISIGETFIVSGPGGDLRLKLVEIQGAQIAIDIVAEQWPVDYQLHEKDPPERVVISTGTCIIPFQIQFDVLHRYCFEVTKENSFVKVGYSVESETTFPSL